MVAWKELVEEWKKRQNNKLDVIKHQNGNGDGNYDEDDLDDPDLPKIGQRQTTTFKKIIYSFKQFPKWCPIERETYLHRLSLRYEKEVKSCELADIDVFMITVDPLKPPLITAYTVLSILTVDYLVDKVACYISNDGAAMLTFEALLETSEFARKWVPFCKKFNIESRALDWYFS
ncbi:hypothetical protein MKW98_006475 [Papaver atlanticum]|uniref:Cellulose synthase n=1 Tax=Papaver atlanticum TaxID=357466 RepID=A0AAD4SI49_9MAGN|nr:hypothetical protein MKW98_006475 [Papaver atlanticum]